MTSVRLLDFLLFFLLHQVYSEEAEPVFRAEGSVIEMGYCFGVDYIVVYRSSLEGDQLLGNSSADDMPSTPPADLQGRIHISNNHDLLGLQISHLTRMDSGIYRRECWQNRILVSQHTQRLFVCDEEVKSKEIIVKEQDRGTELLCNSTSVGLEGASVSWYREIFPSYKLKLFLDSSVSLIPLGDELQGVVEVRDSGASLLVDNSILKNNLHFYCIVIRGKSCLSFQNMFLQDHSESSVIFASQGDKVVLNCPSDGHDQRWETPLGSINGGSLKNNQTYVSFGDKSEDFSLVIPAVADELGGDYSCVSSSLEVQYSLVVCPKKESDEKVVFEGGDIFLDCDVGNDDSQKVQWHHLKPSGEYVLIHDSNDKTVAIPDDMRGRLTLSMNGSSLTISHLEVKDQGVYFCVVSEGPKFLEDDVGYEDDYSEEVKYWESTGEDDLSEDHYWLDKHRCISKQETILSVLKGKRIDMDNQVPLTTEQGTTKLETSTTADPPTDPNVTTYAVAAGLVGLLVLVGVFVAAFVIKRRAKKREAPSRSELNMTNDIKMNVDPGLIQSLMP